MSLVTVRTRCSSLGDTSVFAREYTTLHPRLRLIAHMPFWSRSPPSPAGPANAPKQLTREQQADAELAELLAALDSGHRSATASKEKTRTEQFESSFPSEMNCMIAFDEMYYCYSLGGQFLNGAESLPPMRQVNSYGGATVYRYGGLRDCREKSADWRFCMKAKMYGPVTRKVCRSGVRWGPHGAVYKQLTRRYRLCSLRGTRRKPQSTRQA